MLQQIDVISADGDLDIVFLNDGHVSGCASGKFCGPSGDDWLIGGVLYTTIEVGAEILITMEDTREMIQEALAAISTDAGVVPVTTDPTGDTLSPQLEFAKEVMAEDAEALGALGASVEDAQDLVAVEEAKAEGVYVPMEEVKQELFPEVEREKVSIDTTEVGTLESVLGEIATPVQPETSEIPEGTTAADLGVNAEPDDTNEPEAV